MNNANFDSDLTNFDKKDIVGVEDFMETMQFQLSYGITETRKFDLNQAELESYKRNNNVKIDDEMED